MVSHEYEPSQHKNPFAWKQEHQTKQQRLSITFSETQVMMEAWWAKAVKHVASLPPAQRQIAQRMLQGTLDRLEVEMYAGLDLLTHTHGEVE